MQMPKAYQTGGAANYGYGFPTAEELAAYDQQEADYYGITLDELRQFRQQQGGFAQPSQDQMNRLSPPTDAAGDSPYVSGITQTGTTADATTQQLLFGLDGEGGFIPGAMQAAESTFFNPDGTPRVTPQEVAGFTPDQRRAFELAREQVGIQDRFLGDAESAYREGIARSDEGLERQRALGDAALGTMQRGVAEEQALRDRGLEGLLSSIGEGRDLAAGATTDLYGRLGETEGIQRGAADQFGRRLGETEGIERGAVDQFGNRLSDVEARGEGAADRFGARMSVAEQRGLDAARGFGEELGGIESLQRGAAEDFGGRLGESEALIRGTTGAYDQDLTRQFFDPYEDRVVDQTIEDVLREGDKADRIQFAQDIGRGGESAFGSRARLSADERREALGRGLAKELAGIRSRGFTEAQRMGTSEFARQRAAEAAAGTGLANLSGQRLGAQQQLASGLGSLSGQRFGAETGAADRLTSGAQQRLGAEQGVVDLFGRTGQQQLAAQQGLAGSLGQSGQQQLAAQQGLASGLGQSGQQRYTAGTGLGSTLVGLGQTGQQALSGAGQAALGSAGQLAGAQGNLGSIQGQIGQQQLQSRQGFGGFMQGLGGQAQQAGLAGINALSGFGQQQQQLAQQQLDARRQNLLTAQQAPLQQYQSLLPFIQSVPQGTQQTQTTYAPQPSALQAGLATGLGAFGAIGNFMNPYGRG
jgi:hypothetical protein